MELEEAISQRKSVRHYKEGEVTSEEVAKLLWAASQVPSAGHIHSLKILPVSDSITKEKLCQAALNQRCVAEAFVDLVILADYNRMMRRYHRRGVRYALIEAGHMGQNISLMAVQLGLGCVMIGAFRDTDVKIALGIEVEEPIYIIPVGRV